MDVCCWLSRWNVNLMVIFFLHRVDDWYKFIKSYLLLLLKWTRFLSIFRPLLVSNNYFLYQNDDDKHVFWSPFFFVSIYIYILSFCILMFGYMIHHTHTTCYNVHLFRFLFCYGWFILVDVSSICYDWTNERTKNGKKKKKPES